MNPKYFILTFGHIWIHWLSQTKYIPRLFICLVWEGKCSCFKGFKSKMAQINRRNISWLIKTFVFEFERLSLSMITLCQTFHFGIKLLMSVVQPCPDLTDVNSRGPFMQFHCILFLYICRFYSWIWSDSEWGSVSVWLFVWN